VEWTECGASEDRSVQWSVVRAQTPSERRFDLNEPAERIEMSTRSQLTKDLNGDFLPLCGQFGLANFYFAPITLKCLSFNLLAIIFLLF